MCCIGCGVYRSSALGKLMSFDSFITFWIYCNMSETLTIVSSHDIV